MMTEYREWNGGENPEHPESAIRPIYRGPMDEAKGTRIICAMAQRFDWTHDGSDDDIIGYYMLYDANESPRDKETA